MMLSLNYLKYFDFHHSAVTRYDAKHNLFVPLLGHLYGKGDYFATTADIAYQFGKPDSDGCHYMLLAKLVVGKNHLGAGHLNKPWGGYDSATNGEDTYRVIFDTDCILPYALIRYAIHK